jgi:hypothetical protein
LFASRGLAGPDTSSEEDDEDPHTSDEEIEGASQSSEEEGVQDPRQQLRSADEDEPLNEADLEEWGVGALAANPEEPVSAGRPPCRACKAMVKGFAMCRIAHVIV